MVSVKRKDFVYVIARRAAHPVRSDRLGQRRDNRAAERRPALGAALEAAAPGGFEIAAKAVPLSEVEQAWNTDDGGRRIVFTVDEPR